MATETIQPGYYRHFKGHYYYLEGVAVHSETLEPMVIYRALYDNPHGERWVRPLSMWNEHVEKDDYSGPRFIPVSVEEYRAYRQQQEMAEQSDRCIAEQPEGQFVRSH